jgi:hypothetical protein
MWMVEALMWADPMCFFLVAVAVGTGDVMFMVSARADLPAGVRLMAAAGMLAAATVNSTKT